MVLDTRQVREEQQLAEVGAGIAEADRGEFVKEDDVARVVAKYVKTTSRS